MTSDNGRQEQADLDLGFHRTLTDEQYGELDAEIGGEKVVGVALWEESLADDEGEPPPPAQRDVFDLDLYLENHLYLELYGTYFYRDPASDPLRGLDQLGKILARLVESGVWLDEIAVSEEEELVLVLSQHHEPQLYLHVGGWTLEEWETLPEDD